MILYACLRVVVLSFQILLRKSSFLCQIEMGTEKEDVVITLIESVREEPIIYNKKHPRYMLQNERNLAWKAVAEKVGMPEEYCERKWHLLRDRFTREMRKQNLSSESGQDESKQWKYIENMYFLKAFIAPRKRRTLCQIEMGTENEDVLTTLIESVREAPIIYNKKHPRYMLKNERNLAWKVVAEKVGMPEEYCERKWHLLRDRFTKEMRKQNLSSGSGQDEGQQWEYTENMYFLKAFIAPRKRNFVCQIAMGAENEDIVTSLIESVREELIIYNKKHPRYTIKNERNLAWKAIAEKVGMPAEYCERKWHLLRDRFAKEMRKQNLPSGSGQDEGQQWEYTENMYFLKAFIAPRKTKSNAVFNETIASTSSSPATESDQNMSQSPPVLSPASDNASVCSGFTFETSSYLPKKKKKKTPKKSSHAQVADEFRKSLTAYRDKVHASQSSFENEDELFMRSMIAFMKDFPPLTADRVRKGIFDIVMEERAKLANQNL